MPVLHCSIMTPHDKIMKRFLTTLLIVFTTLAAAWAQQGRPMERIHAAKVAYITARIHLSRQQLTAFMPVYNDYEQEIKDARHFFLKKYKYSFYSFYSKTSISVFDYLEGGKFNLIII